MNSWRRKDLLGLRELGVSELMLLLGTARDFKKLGLQSPELPQTLAGKTVVTLFAEASTRTRISFELAAKRLGSTVVDFNASASSFAKGESLLDTVRTLEAMGLDALVLRHASAGAAHQVAAQLKAHVINAGDGAHEHPTQGLLNAMTLLETWGTLKGKRISIVGDILHSRVARSELWIYTKLGAQVLFAGPEAWVPPEFKKCGTQIVKSLDEALEGADAIHMLRIQHERQSQAFSDFAHYREAWCLTLERLRRAKSDLVVMHVGPMNRGVEIDGEVADGPQSKILELVTNGVFLRMGLLHLMMGGDPKRAKAGTKKGKKS